MGSEINIPFQHWEWFVGQWCMKIGYARVNTGAQTHSLQLDVLAAADCDHIWPNIGRWLVPAAARVDAEYHFRHLVGEDSFHGQLSQVRDQLFRDE